MSSFEAFNATFIGAALGNLQGIFVAIIMLGVLIAVHEFGHFLAAKYYGVFVEKFSIGFGTVLFKKTIGETEYRLSAIPLGGYVSMYGEGSEKKDTMQNLSGRGFTDKSLLVRSVIIMAGPVFNFAFAAILFASIYIFFGKSEKLTFVGYVAEAYSDTSPNGIMEGDRIIRIGELDVEYWSQVNDYVADRAGDVVSVDFVRGNIVMTSSVNVGSAVVQNVFGEAETIGDLRLRPRELVIIGSVMEDHPAYGKLQEGDEVISVAGYDVSNWFEMGRYIRLHPGEAIVFGVSRGGDLIDVSITPKSNEIEDADGNIVEVGYIGVMQGASDQDVVRVRSNPIYALYLGVKDTYKMSKLILVSVVKMFQGVVKTDNIGGPVAIVSMASKTASTGLLSLIFYTAFISINLAIINLLPIPILDGGALLFNAVEGATGRPIPNRIKNAAHTLGVVLLGTLLFFALYNDFTKILLPMME